MRILYKSRNQITSRVLLRIAKFGLNNKLLRKRFSGTPENVDFQFDSCVACVIYSDCVP